MAKTVSPKTTHNTKRTTDTRRAKSPRIICVDGEPYLALRGYLRDCDVADLQEAVAASRWGHIHPDRVGGINIRATWTTANSAGVYNVNVGAGTKGLYLFGIAEMSRDETVRMAIRLLTGAAALHGLTDDEREKLREINAIEPMFGPRPVAKLAAVVGGEHAQV